MPRRDTYIDSYARAAASARRYADIQASIANDEQRLAYLDSLINSERQSLAALEETFRVRPVDLTQLNNLLAQEGTALAQAARKQAGAAAGRQAATSAHPSVVKAVEGYRRKVEDPAVTVQGSDRDAVGEAVKAAAQAGMTQETYDATVKLLQDAGGLDVPLGSLNDLKTFAVRKQTPSGKADVSEELGAAGQLAADIQDIQRRGPEGIRGGAEAEALVEKRKGTMVKGFDALTQQQLLDAYIDASGVGTPTVESMYEMGLVAEGDVENAAALLSEGKRLFLEARRTQAYRNDQIADFDLAVTGQRDRVRALEAERAKAAAKIPDDPAKEAARRELIARGINPDDPYIAFRGTPAYDYLTRADEVFNASVFEGKAKPVAPSSKLQGQVASLIRMYKAQGIPVKLNRLEQDLGKNLRGKDLTDAIGFGLAYARSQDEGLNSPQSAEDLRRREAERAKFEKQTAERAKRSAETLEASVEAGRELEAEQVAKVQGLRADQAQMNSVADEYRRLRAAGVSIEEARVRALEAKVTMLGRQDPGEILVDGDFNVERQRRTAEKLDAPKVTTTGAVIEAPSAQSVAPTPDPSNPDYAYLAVGDGGFRVFFKGEETGAAKPGSRAATSIESVLGGGSPLSRAPAPAPAPSSPLVPDPAAELRAQQEQAKQFPSSPLLSTPVQPVVPAPPRRLTEEELLRKYGGAQ